MHQIFINHIQQHIQFNEKEQDFLTSNLPIVSFKKGELLLAEGNISDCFYYNLSGCVRLFYTVKGEEKTAYFYTENQFISSYESYVKQVPSIQNFQAIEATNVLMITVDVAERLLAMTPKFEILARMAMEEEMIHYQRLIASFVTQSPQERYESLLSANPELFQRIPQHYIASYLGITPESLSRIKKKIYLKSKKS